MTIITPELRQMIERAVDSPARFVDPETNESYVILKAEDYERICDVSHVNREAQPEDMYPFIDEAFGRAGWDDPKMDDYNDYKPRSS